MYFTLLSLIFCLNTSLHLCVHSRSYHCQQININKQVSLQLHLYAINYLLNVYMLSMNAKQVEQIVAV